MGVPGALDESQDPLPGLLIRIITPGRFVLRLSGISLISDREGAAELTLNSSFERARLCLTAHKKWSFLPSISSCPVPGKEESCPGLVPVWLWWS